MRARQDTLMNEVENWAILKKEREREREASIKEMITQVKSIENELKKNEEEEMEAQE
jgi:hypothetical protein